jgi:RNA polymerase sigma-70 factor, ECF subfamily
LDNKQPISAHINEIYHQESRRVLASLIRLLRDFDLAEEALHDAFIAALAQWSTEGISHNPRACWVLLVGVNTASRSDGAFGTHAGTSVA